MRMCSTNLQPGMIYGYWPMHNPLHRNIYSFLPHSGTTDGIAHTESIRSNLKNKLFSRYHTRILRLQMTVKVNQTKQTNNSMKGMREKNFFKEDILLKKKAS